MFISKLTLTHFKNYAEAQFRFSPNLNVFYGKNGAGKTNVLDAIYYLAITRSYFNAVDQQQVQHGENYFTVEADLVKGELSETIRLFFQRGIGKKLLVQQNEVEKFSDHIGKMPVVMIAPGDIQLIYEGSEERRKFFDLLISTCNRIYLNQLQAYNKSLDQRNKLLKDFYENRYFDRDLLNVYNEQLLHAGSYIQRVRNQFITDFRPLFMSNYRRLVGEAELVNLTYESELNRIPFQDLLLKSESADIDLLRTTKGVHKDDWVFEIEGQSLKKFGSQGQQKTYIIALKLAQFQYLHMQKSEKPILLLDDIFEKLDMQRLQQLFAWISEGLFGQIFITDTQESRLRAMLETIDLPCHYFQIPLEESSQN
ncbi:MAG: DNA replication/repair protein RecF [Bacteroidia bacterium]|nr:DNA replication/repair protein RecF [Bacteroidia bacterium]